MILYRQKTYALPAIAALGGKLLTGLNAVGNGAMIASIPMGIAQSKQQEELAEQQKERDMQTVKALNNIAKQAAKNPETAQAAMNVMSQAQQQRQFSKIGKGISTAVREVGALGKNVGKIIGKDSHVLIGGTMAGMGMAGASYLTDKAIQADMKKNNIELPKVEEKSYSKVSSIMSTVKPVIGKAFKKNKGMILTTAVLGSAPTALDYVSKREALKDQYNSTGNNIEQRSYSIFNGIKNIGSSISKNWNILKSHPGQTILGGISNMSGGGGRHGVRGFGRKLKYLGKKDGSKLTEKTGQFIMDHPKTATAASIPVGLGLMTATWDQGDKLINKTARKLDKNAYKYQDFNNQQIY